MYKYFTRIITATLLLPVFTVFAQQNTTDRIRLKNGAIPAASLTWKTGKNLHEIFPSARKNKPFLGLIRLDRYPQEADKEKLRTLGVHLQGYIPDRAWVAVISDPAAVARLGSFGFGGILELTPEMKADRNILEGNLSASTSRIPGMADLWIRFPAYYPADSVKKWLQEEQVLILSGELAKFGILGVRTATERILALAALEYIEYIQEYPEPDEKENYKNTVRSRSTPLRSTHGLYQDGLLGRNVVIGVGDDTDPVRHIDFSGRLINRFNTVGGTGHGLHTMGTVGGGGIIREDLTGFAPKSRIVSHYFSNILTYSPEFYSDFGMRLTNNSYGQTITGDESFRRYDLYSALLDQMAKDYPDLLHVFAAGNSGYTNYDINPYRQEISGQRGFGTVHKSYQSAKNVLVVGNVDSLNVRNIQSSRGPVQDGRLKPEIVAEGMRIISTLRDNTYGLNSGTSMAAPAVTGGAALLIEQYKRQFPSAGSPPGTLLKALLCNGATDLGSAGPDYSFGYGVMNLWRSSEMLRNSSFTSGSVSSGNAQSGTITIPANTARLKVMLCWNDAPGHPLSSGNLVNDLDLSVSTGGTTVLPYVNNTSPGSVSAAATRGTDRVNNIEQVVIDNPSPGQVSFTVSGYNVPAGPQDYYVVYDVIPAGTTLTAPFGGEKFIPGSRVLVTWESHGAATAFHLEYSDGDAWTRIASNLPAATRQYYWTMPADLASGTMKVRVIRALDNGVSAGGDFIVLGQPVLTLSGTSEQCEGMISVSWNSVPGATGYELLRLKNGEMTSTGSVSSSQLQYNFTGLSPDSTYWVSVRALADGGAGLRAIAQSRRPDSGNCSHSLSNGDVAVTKLVSPSGSGRVLTGSALTGSHPVKIRVRNLDNTASQTRSAVVSCKINNGAAVNETITIPAMAALAERELTLSTTANLSAPGTYRFEISLSVSGDQIPDNNTLVAEVSQLANEPVSLALSPSVREHIDSFSTLAGRDYYYRHTGLEGADRYDFESSHTGGRLRSFVNTGIARSGDRAVTVDADAYPHTSTVNYLTGTYNLAGYNANNDDIRLTFWYMQHGQGSDSENKVWIRGSGTSAWIEIFNLFSNQETAGQYKPATGIELSSFLKSKGQNFGAGTQIRWGQKGTYQTASPLDINGYTFDDIRLYLAANDVQMKEITAPAVSNCELGSQEPVAVTVYNSMNYPLNNIQVSYQVNEGPVVTETIPSIASRSDLTYTFNTTADLSAFRTYIIRAWVSLQGDNEPLNNEMSIKVINSPLITSYPYLQDFETDNGSWYADGKYSSWEYGTPASTGINRAASGTKAWKTSLAGNYNDNELSYLYSPCFRLDGLASPMLSFMIALDIEDCGDPAFCDGAWIEYSFNGTDWTRLGSKNQGTNWYNRSYTAQTSWSHENYTRWHVASIPLPLPAGSSGSSIRLRFVMNSDLFQNREGIALDDIHVYDRLYEISGTSEEIPAVSQVISSNAGTWTDFVSGGKIIASLNAAGSLAAPGEVLSRSYLHSQEVRSINGTYYHNRNFVIQPSATSLSPGAGVRLYFADSEMETMIAATGCDDCHKTGSVVDLGISKYTASDKSLENGTTSDNTSGSWQFIAPASVSKVPYDKGYYLEFSTATFSEFWLSPVPFFTASTLPVTLRDFTAQKGEYQEVILNWSIAALDHFSHFEIQRAAGNDALKKGLFETLGAVYPDSESPLRSYSFTDYQAPAGSVVYYRLKMTDLDGTYLYSDIRSVMSGGAAPTLIYPNPSEDGIFFLAYQSSGKISYTVTDAAGRKISSAEVQGDGFMRKAMIDLKTFGPGTYLIEVITEEKKSAFKVIRL